MRPPKEKSLQVQKGRLPLRRLPSAWRRALLVSMQAIQAWIVGFAVLSLLQCAHANTFVATSQGAQAGLEQEFIRQTTTYFDAKVTSNPFYAGTYSVTLNGLNFYHPSVYLYGYRDGAENQVKQDLGTISQYVLSCGTDTVCATAFGQLYSEIYDEDVSTITVISNGN